VKCPAYRSRKFKPAECGDYRGVGNPTK
jgi:hypothetical protein